MADHKSYNMEALRGAPTDDMEYVEHLGLDPSVAYSDKINEAMLDLTYKQSIAGGTSEEDAMKNRTEARKNINVLLARKGMLPK